MGFLDWLTPYGRPGYHREPYYSAQIAADANGVAEFRLRDGRRVDVLTDDYAIEVEWPEKWPEAIGQSVGYAIETKKQPCVYLLYTGPQDDTYVSQCRKVCDHLAILLVTRPVEPK